MDTFWPIHWLKPIAARVLRKEMQDLKSALLQMNEELQESERRRANAYGLYKTIRDLNKDLQNYCNWLVPRTDGGDAQSRLLFFRDMLDHGPNGPRVGSSGVHPADRWNINTYHNFKREQTGD